MGGKKAPAGGVGSSGGEKWVEMPGGGVSLVTPAVVHLAGETDLLRFLCQRMA